MNSVLTAKDKVNKLIRPMNLKLTVLQAYLESDIFLFVSIFPSPDSPSPCPAQIIISVEYVITTLAYNIKMSVILWICSLLEGYQFLWIF